MQDRYEKGLQRETRIIMMIRMAIKFRIDTRSIIGLFIIPKQTEPKKNKFKTKIESKHNIHCKKGSRHSNAFNYCCRHCWRKEKGSSEG